MRYEKNVGRLDQILRGGIGALLIYLGFFSGMIPDSFSSILVGGIGVSNVLVSIIRICPLYYAVGINTCQAE